MEDLLQKKGCQHQQKATARFHFLSPACCRCNPAFFNKMVPECEILKSVQSYQRRLVAVSHLDQLFKQKNTERYLLGFPPNKASNAMSNGDDAANMHQVKASPPVPMIIRFANTLNTPSLGLRGAILLAILIDFGILVANEFHPDLAAAYKLDCFFIIAFIADAYFVLYEN